MPTLLDACNQALTTLGKRPNVSSLKNPTNTEESVFASIAEQSKFNVIRENRPNCCVGRARLVQDAKFIPSYEFNSGFRYPSDMIRLLEIDNNRYQFKIHPIEGKFILSHARKPAQGEPAPVMLVKYLQNKNVEDLDRQTFELLVLRLARDAASVIDATRESGARAKYQEFADEFAADNAMENGFEVVEFDTLRGTMETIQVN